MIIKLTYICVQYTRHVFNYRGLPQTMIIFARKFDAKNLMRNFSKLRYIAQSMAVTKTQNRMEYSVIFRLLTKKF